MKGYKTYPISPRGVPGVADNPIAIPVGGKDYSSRLIRQCVSVTNVVAHYSDQVVGRLIKALVSVNYSALQQEACNLPEQSCEAYLASNTWRKAWKSRQSVMVQKQ